jgi:hypothetical protein
MTNVTATTSYRNQGQINAQNRQASPDNDVNQVKHSSSKSMLSLQACA